MHDSLAYSQSLQGNGHISIEVFYLRSGGSKSVPRLSNVISASPARYNNCSLYHCNVNCLTGTHVVDLTYDNHGD